MDETHQLPESELLHKEETNKEDNEKTKEQGLIMKINELEKQLELKTNENTYLLAQLKIHANSHNKGEKDEALIIMKLFRMNQENQYDKLIEIFGDEASDGIHMICMNSKTIINDIFDIGKAKGAFKADCTIEMVKSKMRYTTSIKSKNGANPAILNHTPRTAKVFQPDGVLYSSLDAMDKMIKEYIEKRSSTKFGEDVSINEFECLNESYMLEEFKKVVSYFVFDGTGKGNSICRANSIIYYEGNTIEFIKCTEPEEKRKYIDSIFHDLVISLRDKGMPSKLSETCHPWIYHDSKGDGTIKAKGSLHIRIK